MHRMDSDSIVVRLSDDDLLIDRITSDPVEDLKDDRVELTLAHAVTQLIDRRTLP